MTDYQSQMIEQKIKAACLKWLCPSEHTAEEATKDVCVEHYVAVLPYEPKWWVTCTLKEALLLMEAYIVS